MSKADEMPEGASIAEFRRRVREAIHPTTGKCGPDSTGCHQMHHLASVDCLNLLGRGDFALARLLLHEYDKARAALASDPGPVAGLRNGSPLREGVPGNDSEGRPICWCGCGCQKRRPPHWDRCPDCVNGKHLPAPAAAGIQVERLARAFLVKSGYFGWGPDAWIHKDDEGTVMSTVDALDAAYARLAGEGRARV